MPNPHLVNLLKTFSNKEWKKFPSFLASPFFEVRYRNELKILSSTIQRYLKQKKTLPNAPFLWKKLNKKIPLNDSQMSNYLWELHRTAQCFIVHYQYEHSDHFLTDQMQACIDRDLSYQVNKIKKKVESQEKERLAQDEQDYFRAYEWKRWIDIFRGKNDAAFNRVQHLQMMILDVDYGYLIGKLKQYYFLLSKDKLTAEAIPYISSFKTYLNEIVEIHHRLKQPLPPLLEFYYQFLRTTEEKTEDNVEYLRLLLTKYGKLLDDRDKANARQTISNFYVTKINDGERQYKHKLFKYYQSLDEEKLLTNSKEKIDYKNYRNIVLVVLRLIEQPNDDYHIWIKAFIDKYRHAISPEIYQTCIYHYVLARLYFQQQEWRLVEEQIKEAIIENKSTGLRERNYEIYTWKETLHIRLLYEQGHDYDWFKSKTKTFHGSIRRTKHISANWKERGKAFIKFVKKLYEIRENFDQQKCAKLAVDMNGKEALYKDWLREKLQLLRNQ